MSCLERPSDAERWIDTSLMLAGSIAAIHDASAAVLAAVTDPMVVPSTSSVVRRSPERRGINQSQHSM